MTRGMTSSATTRAEPTGTQPLTVVHVDQETGYSGGEAQVLGLVQGLRERGHRCIVTGPENGLLAARGKELGWDWRDLTIKSDADMRAILRLARLLKAERADIVHLHTGRAAWIGGWAARQAGVPAIVTRRQDKRLGSWKHKLTYARLAAIAVGISPGVSEQLTAAGVEPGRLETIWSSVNPSSVRSTTPRAELRAELDLKPGTYAIGCLAALVSRKGLDVAIRALGLMQTPGPSVLLIAGDGPDRQRLETLAQTNSANRRVRFLGQLAEPARLLGAIDAFCLPSRNEGLGVAALEAMAAGCAVVATRVGGLGAAVADAGLLVDPDDPKALAEALDALHPASGEELARELGARARARIDEQFLFTTQVQRYEALYRRLACEETHPARHTTC